MQRKWATLASWSNRRSMKYRHTLDGALGLGGAEISVLAVLMLRGPQTPGELKTRTERLHSFGEMGDLIGTLDRLIERSLVAQLDRRPGQREERYTHLLSEDGAEEPGTRPEPAAPVAEPAPASPAEAPPPAATAPAAAATGDAERIERIERQLAELRAEIQALRDELGA